MTPHGDHDAIEYHFSVTITVRAEPDEKRLRALIGEELRRATAAVAGKTR